MGSSNRSAHVATGMMVAAILAMSGVAAAQVGPTSWSFEIDGDHGSQLANTNVDTNPAYLQSDEVFDDGRSTYGRLQHHSCYSWTHGAFEPYMGHDSYRVHCDIESHCAPTPEDCDGACVIPCPKRRSEQMLLAGWLAGGSDTTRYFSFAFRLNELPPIPTGEEDKRGYIMQLHHGLNASVPIQVSWAMRDGQLFLESGVRGQRVEGLTIVDTFEWLIERQPRDIGVPEVPLEPNVWYRMLLSVRLGSNVNAQGCPIYTPTDLGEVRAWLMNNETGLWDQYFWVDAPIGSLTDVYGVMQVGSQCEYQWKTGIYSNPEDLITMYLDNVRYGKWARRSGTTRASATPAGPSDSRDRTT